MRYLRNNRGVILRVAVLGLAVAVLPGAFVTLKTLLLKETQVAAAPAMVEAILAEREAAHALLRAGEVEAGAQALLASLRALPDNPALLDAAHGTLQLLAFAMVGLMRDEALASFQAELDPAQWPIDGLVSAYCYRELEDYARWRKMTPFTSEEMWARIEALHSSRSALVRAGSLLLAASPYLWTRIGPAEVLSMLNATNQLAEVLPGSRLLREVVREHVRAVVGPGLHPLPDVQALFAAMSGQGLAEAEAASQRDLGEAVPLADGLAAVDALINMVPWNSEVAAILAEDPVVDLVLAARGKAAAMAARPGIEEAVVRQACLGDILAAGLAHPDASVRDWGLRSAVHVDGWLHAQAWSEEAAAVRNACTLRAAALGSPPGRAPVEGARAAVTALEVSARRDEASGTAEALGTLALQARDSEPIDMNLFEQGPRRLGHFGYALVREGEYDDAIAVFDRLAAAYPNSLLGDKWSSDAAHLRSVQDR